MVSLGVGTEECQIEETSPRDNSADENCGFCHASGEECRETIKVMPFISLCDVHELSSVVAVEYPY